MFAGSAGIAGPLACAVCTPGVRTSGGANGIGLGIATLFAGSSGVWGGNAATCGPASLATPGVVSAAVLIGPPGCVKPPGASISGVAVPPLNGAGVFTMEPGGLGLTIAEAMASLLPGGIGGTGD